MELFIIIALVFMALFGIGKGIMIMWILFGLFMFSMYPNVLVLLFGVFMPMMVMWETREKTKKQTRIRPGRLSTIRRGSSKEYDQGWDAASNGTSYEKAPYDITTKQGREWRMGHNHFRQYGYEKLKKRKGNN